MRLLAKNYVRRWRQCAPKLNAVNGATSTKTEDGRTLIITSAASKNERNNVKQWYNEII